MKLHLGPQKLENGIRVRHGLMGMNPNWQTGRFRVRGGVAQREALAEEKIGKG